MIDAQNKQGDEVHSQAQSQERVTFCDYEKFIDWAIDSMSNKGTLLESEALPIKQALVARFHSEKPDSAEASAITKTSEKLKNNFYFKFKQVPVARENRSAWEATFISQNGSVCGAKQVNLGTFIEIDNSTQK